MKIWWSDQWTNEKEMQKTADMTIQKNKVSSSEHMKEITENRMSTRTNPMNEKKEEWYLSPICLNLSRRFPPHDRSLP